ncbi:MAG: ATP adenylyltransferase family protein [Leptolyngbya sp. IPPAS B-1204]
MGEMAGQLWNQPGLQPGALWAKVVAQTRHALSCGALQPIPTRSDFIDQNRIRFLVRVLDNLARKAAADRQQEQQAKAGKDFNPFLPYDPDLFVADLSSTHVCLLNKYNVVDHHLLLITREFEEQESLLTQPDFEALWLGLAEIDGMGFYNSGKTAGASQRHKHLQLVPLPLIPDGDRIPIEPALMTATWPSEIGSSTDLPFRHAVIRLDGAASSPQQAAQATLEAYYKLLTALKLYSPVDHSLQGAYNLLITRQWMLMVPRKQEQFASIPVNSLGFAGTLFVRNQDQFERLKAIGPLRLLQEVADGHQP